MTATDADADHVTLTASGLPAGATFVDNSNNTGTFHWTPGSTQSGTYTLTFTGNDGHGGTNTATTVITVLDVTGGGGGDATATIIGKIKSKTKTVCFRIVPVNGAFDLRNVDVASVTLDFGGGSVHALSGRTHVAFDCSGGGDDGDDDAEECHDCGDGGDHDGGSWGDDHGDGDDGDHEGTVDTGSCVATHLHACFSMHDLRALLGVSDIRSRLLLATISGNLTTGGSFVATIGTRVAHEDNGHGGDQGGKGSHDIHCKTSPNPLNPETLLSFTLSQAGRVRVTIYDLQGRLVKTLLDENRNTGEQALLWNGTNAKNGRGSSGLYFIKVQTPEAQVVRRVTVLK